LDAQPSPDTAIDEDLRRRFEQAWLAGQPLRIEDCLPPRTSPAWLATLEELVHIELEFAWKTWAQWRQEEWSGQGSPAAPQRVEQYLARFPSLDEPQIVARLVEQECLVRAQAGQSPAAEEYEQTLGNLLVTRTGGDTLNSPAATWRSDWSAAGRHAGKDQALTRLPRRLGNYELLSEIGRGGMGVVYRARQLSVDRIVALKVIRADQLGSRRPPERAAAIERFRHEALAAARLAHEHIVTVYEVGEADGERFFSMRFVEGQSLADMLSQGQPLSGRKAVAYLEPVARAIATAHEAGILHRDLKPQNILVDAKTDRALVADFGLAKLTEQTAELTRAGEVMGTPAYMSPEQARDATTVTVRSDVYSLGATLYHAITARPPFQAATSLETLRQAHEEEPDRPSQFNPAIDRDLETICLTCLHKEPARRYPSASALADDLRRYLDRLPIQARPVGPVERLARWCGRNPLLAAASGLAAAFFVAALAATSAGYLATSAALREKTKALTEKSRALEASDRSYRQSREVVNQFFTLVSEDTLLNQPGAQPLRSDLLKLALVHYERFLAERGADPTLLQEIARTHYRVGLIKQSIDPDPAAGRAALARALGMQRDLVSRTPSASLESDLGDTLNALGHVLQQSGEGEKALALLKEAQGLRRKLAAQRAGDSEYARKLANTTMNIGLIYKKLDRPVDAARSLDEAQAARQKALGGRPIESAGAQELLLWRDLAMGHYNRANLAVAMKEPAVADKELVPAIDVFEQIERTAPNDFHNRERLAACYHLAARQCQERHDDAEAARRYAQAIVALEVLHNFSPQVVEFQERLALALMDHGALLTTQKNAERALQAYKRACEHLGNIVPEPDSTEHAERRRNYAVALREQARAEIDFGQKADAEELLERSVAYLEPLIEQAKDNRSRKLLEEDLEQTRRLQRMLPTTSNENG
jgi:tetratricopeptide (TPR) repeat protein/predicted Ser/Thr protein kinase